MKPMYESTIQRGVYSENMDVFLEFIDSLPDSLIYITLWLSALIENLFPPVPGDSIIVFGAFLVGTGRLNFFGAYFATTFGSFLGFMILFWIGTYLGRRFFIEKDYRFIKAKNIIRAEAWLKKYGYLLIALNRFLPGIRSVISITGGMTGLSVTKVGVLALISCAVWNFLWTLLGYALGSNWGMFKVKMFAIMLRYNIAIVLLFILSILIIVLGKRFKMRK